MCSRYQSVRIDSDLRQYFQARLRHPDDEAALQENVFPGLVGAFIRRPPERASGDEAVPAREAVTGRFGLLPHWTRDDRLGRSTYNARSETVALKPAFRDAWRQGRHCIVPAHAFYEPDWRSGRHVPARIARADGRPLGIAGLWDRVQLEGISVLSFTMLTVNADGHAVMCNYHRPDDEKRMVVLLREDNFDAWLDAPAAQSMAFMRACPPEDLVAVAEPR